MLVSVIIPTHNRANLLGRAIQSVLEQTFTRFELIIVDDGSTDETENLVRNFRDKRISYCRQKNMGATAARNTGLELARGDYVSFLDSDDEWTPTKIERQLEVFCSSALPNLGLVTCGHRIVRLNGETSDWLPKRRGWLHEDALEQRQFGWGTPLLLVKRQCLLDFGVRFDPDLPARQDWDFVTRLSEHVQVDFVPEALLIVHEHPGDRVRTPARAVAANLYLHDKYEHILEARPTTHARFHLRTAMLCLSNDDLPVARREIRKAISVKPVSLVPYLWFAAWSPLLTRIPTVSRLARRFLPSLTFR